MAKPKTQSVAPVITKRRRIELLRAQLDNVREQQVPDWKELGEFVAPRRGRFSSSDVNRGGRRASKIIDTSASLAARTLSSGMMSGVTNPASPWFRLTTSDYELGEQPDVRAYLDEVTDRMRKVLSRTNWYNVLPGCYNDLGVFSTHAILMAEDLEDVVRFYAFPIGSYSIANDAKGRVRYFIREFQMTVGQIVEAFGIRDETGMIGDWSNISPATREAYERGELQTMRFVVHAVMPNPEHQPKRFESKFKRFYACYYERGATTTDTADDVFLEEKGFDEFPLLIPRWEVTGEDSWGSSCPAMLALGDIKQLQHGEKKGAKGLDKSIDPPMVGPPALAKSRASLLPGDITYVQENQHAQFHPAHEVTIDLEKLERKQQQVRNRIDRAFFTDLFLMLAYSDQAGASGTKTATEIQERHEEKLLALGPVLQQLDQELLNPCIVRLYSIMQRQGMLPDPPEALQGKAFDIEYISIMAQAQKLVGLGSIERLAGFVANLATTSQDPTVWDKVDRDQMIDEFGEAAGVPSRLIVPDEKVAEVRAAKAQAVAAQQQAALATQASTAARNLSQTDTSSKNGLTDLLGLGTA